MSQPSTTSQKPKPPLGSGSTTPRNLVVCRYLPRNTPSMSLTATLIRCAPDLRMAATAGCSLGTGLARVLILSPSVLFCSTRSDQRRRTQGCKRLRMQLRCGGGEHAPVGCHTQRLPIPIGHDTTRGLNQTDHRQVIV